MNNRLTITGLLALALMALSAAGCASDRHDQAVMLAQAHVNREEAGQAALAKTPGGSIKNAELDNDQGKLIWWFDIAIPGSKEPAEVSVDAITGGVISVTTETPDL